MGSPGPAAKGAVPHRARMRVEVEGIVQGVGFRPFVHSLALGLGLAGSVGNDSRGVVVEVEGDEADLTRFLAAVRDQAPPLAVVERVRARRLAPTGAAGFTILASQAGGRREALVSPDVGTCADCLAELFDPSERRHRYPFTNCTNCGPRFSIVVDVPYDRATTTMAGFALCADCAREYHDPTDRRFHAQPVCCPACGPQLSLVEVGPAGDLGGRPGPGGEVRPMARAEEALAGALDRLRAGQVLAVKGLGGYHLAADALQEPAVAALRSRKHREDKPFALMVPDLAWAGRLGRMEEAERALLSSWRAPIVLLERSGAMEGVEVAPSVAPGNRSLGVMLPYTPLHHLLMSGLGRPLVLTSGNISDEPIAYLDDDALARLAGVAEAFLLHDRPIHHRVDDSVVRVQPARAGHQPSPAGSGGQQQGRHLVLRRSRGFAPEPLALAQELARPVLGCGAELKATFCLAGGHHAFVSHHIGDLENYETLRSYQEGIEHFQRLFALTPAVMAHDLHPEYLSTKWAQEQTGVELVGVQHHHAHIASCLAEHGEEGPVIGVAFDGLGLGTDHTLWGGEFLVADLAGFHRHGHLAPVPMPGGAAAIREPWRMAAAYLDTAYGARLPPGLAIRDRHDGTWETVVAMARSGTNAPLTSSAGRLFDAVAALCGLRDQVNYEGQAAIELEQRVDPSEMGAYPVGLSTGRAGSGGHQQGRAGSGGHQQGPTGPVVVHGADLVRAAVDDLAAGAAVGAVAARFHRGLAQAVVEVCARLAAGTGLATVALSGGVFQNMVLTQAVVAGLERRALTPLVHSRVPPNDGGISLGQVVVAGARDRRPPLAPGVAGLGSGANELC